MRRKTFIGAMLFSCFIVVLALSVIVFASQLQTSAQVDTDISIMLTQNNPAPAPMPEAVAMPAILKVMNAGYATLVHSRFDSFDIATMPDNKKAVAKVVNCPACHISSGSTYNAIYTAMPKNDSIVTDAKERNFLLNQNIYAAPVLTATGPPGATYIADSFYGALREDASATMLANDSILIMIC